MDEPTKQELIDASAALGYEISMLIASINAMAEIADKPDDQVHQGLRNVWFESFLLHTRQLACFLSDGKQIGSKPWTLYADDLHPQEYMLSNGQWSQPPTDPVDIAELDNVISYANKRLAHLTRIRKDPPPIVDCALVARIIRDWFDRFLKAADDAKLHPTLIALKEEWRDKEVPSFLPKLTWSTSALPQNGEAITFSTGRSTSV